MWYILAAVARYILMKCALMQRLGVRGEGRVANPSRKVHWKRIAATVLMIVLLAVAFCVPGLEHLAAAGFGARTALKTNVGTSIVPSAAPETSLGDGRGPLPVTTGLNLCALSGLLIAAGTWAVTRSRTGREKRVSFG